MKTSYATHITFALYYHILDGRLSCVKNLRPYIRIKLGNLPLAPLTCMLLALNGFSKLKPDGSMDHLKAHLVEKGYHQVNGVDYTESFSPVIKPGIIRLIITIAPVQIWSI